MKLAMLRRPNENQQPTPSLTLVGKPAAILPWPNETETESRPVRAELRTKRFTDREVCQDQFSATVASGARSVSAILAALAEACASVEELGRAIGDDDHLILNIQVRV